MSFGWSEHDFRSAFVKQPMFMWCSEKKITAFMDFFVNKLGLKPSDVAKCPNLFLTSFVKRIIPRCSVVQVLISKGLKVKKNFDVVWILNLDKKTFETKFLIPFKDDAPEVIKAYQEGMGLQGFNDGLQLFKIDTKWSSKNLGSCNGLTVYIHQVVLTTVAVPHGFVVYIHSSVISGITSI